MIRAPCASRDKRNSSPLPPSTRQICRVVIVAPTLSDSNCPYLLHALAPQGQSPRRGRDARLSDNSNIAQPFPQPSSNRFPTPRQPSETSTHPQPSFNRHATARQSQPRRNRFQITFQPPEAARRTIPRLANIHDSTILRVESKNDFNTTIPHSRSSDSTTTTTTTKRGASIPRNESIKAGGPKPARRRVSGSRT